MLTPFPNSKSRQTGEEKGQAARMPSAIPARPSTSAPCAPCASTRVRAQRRAATIPARRSVKKAHQAAWLLKAITCIDLTTLSGDDTAPRVRRLCAKARRPLSADLLEALGVADMGLTCGAVCVYHAYVAEAVAALEGSGVPVAAVSTGFPAGLTPHDLKLK